MSEQSGILAGVPVWLGPHEDVLRNVERRIEQRIYGGYISITNTESMYHALRVPAHMQFILGANHSLCDGVGVILAGWFWGLRIRRYNGPILQLDCAECGQA